MERRTVLGVIAGGLLAAPLAAEGQVPEKTARIGLLRSESRPLDDRIRQNIADVRAGLQDEGYAEIALCDAPANMAAAETSYRRGAALAEELLMRPLVAHCHLGLAKLHRRTGQREQATKHLTTATAMYREMDVQLWLEPAEAEIRELLQGCCAHLLIGRAAMAMTMTIERVMAFMGLDVLVAKDEGLFAAEGLDLRIAALPPDEMRSAAEGSPTKPTTNQGKLQARGDAQMFQA